MIALLYCLCAALQRQIHSLTNHSHSRRLLAEAWNTPTIPLPAPPPQSPAIALFPRIIWSLFPPSIHEQINEDCPLYSHDETTEIDDFLSAIQMQLPLLHYEDQQISYWRDQIHFVREFENSGIECMRILSAIFQIPIPLFYRHYFRKTNWKTHDADSPPIAVQLRGSIPLRKHCPDVLVNLVLAVNGTDSSFDFCSCFLK